MNQFHNTDYLFFELIQVTFGTQICLSHTPTADEWGELYAMAKKQSLVGVCFAGLQRLQVQRQEPPKILYLTWMGMAAKIQQKNETINRQCVEVQKMFLVGGLETCILKGQGIGSYYNDDLRLLRQSGDIDIWVNGDWRAVMDYVNARTPNREFDMKHTHLEAFDDTIVEVHWWPSMPVNPLYAKALHRYYTEQAPLQCKHMVSLPNVEAQIAAPDAKFETIHVLYHIFNHFLYEGVGLRQMMDLYFVLVNGGMTYDDCDEVARVAKEVGLARFAPAAMWVLEQVFGMDASVAFCKEDSQLGQVLLNEIIEGGNFGHDSKENKVYNEGFMKRMARRLKRRIRLVKYNPVGLLCSPFTKIRIMLWKRMVIKKYNL